MVSVFTDDLSFGIAIGHLAETMRGKWPFHFGETIRFGSAISNESEYDAFLVFAPPFLNKNQKSVRIDDFTCNITGLYPMYSSEILVYESLGLEKFWHHPDWDPFDIGRPPIIN